MKKLNYATILLFLFLTACASQNLQLNTSPAIFYGFFYGIWHGYIWLFSLIGSIFFENISIIGKPNTGWLYYFGFFIGVCLFFYTPKSAITTIAKKAKNK